MSHRKRRDEQKVRVLRTKVSQCFGVKDKTVKKRRKEENMQVLKVLGE